MNVLKKHEMTKRQKHYVIFFCLHVEFNEWNNKCNLCKHKPAEAINLSNHKRRHHTVNYFCVNTISKLCPRIKLPPWHTCNEWTNRSAPWNDIGRNHHKYIAMQHAKFYVFASQNVLNEFQELTFPLYPSSPLSWIKMNSWQSS